MKNVWIINHYALPPSLGGLNRHYFFKRELEKKGYNVRIFTASQIHNSNLNQLAKEKCFSKEITVDGIEYSYIKTNSYKGNGFSRIKNMLEFAWKIKKIPKHYKNEKPDVVYTSSPDLFTAYYAEKLAKKLKVPCIVEVRDLWPLSIAEYKGISNNNPIIKCLYSLEKKIYKKADALIFTMKGGKQYILDKKWNKKVNLNKIFNINNGIDLELFNQQVCTKKIDENIFDNSKFNITYVGSIREVNNIGIILDVAKQIKQMHSDIQFLIYGDGTQKKVLEERLIEENIDNVKFMGRIDGKYVPYICKNSNINIINVQQSGISKYGVSWNKLFQYLAAGKPIISTTKVNYDIISENNCGITTLDQKTETITEAILKIYNMTKNEYFQICENSKNSAKKFDFKVLTNKLLDVINYVIKEK